MFGYKGSSQRIVFLAITLSTSLAAAAPQERRQLGRVEECRVLEFNSTLKRYEPSASPPFQENETVVGSVHPRSKTNFLVKKNSREFAIPNQCFRSGARLKPVWYKIIEPRIRLVFISQSLLVSSGATSSEVIGQQTGLLAGLGYSFKINPKLRVEGELGFIYGIAEGRGVLDTSQVYRSNRPWTSFRFTPSVLWSVMPETFEIGLAVPLYYQFKSYLAPVELSAFQWKQLGIQFRSQYDQVGLLAEFGIHGAWVNTFWSLGAAYQF